VAGADSSDGLAPPLSGDAAAAVRCHELDRGDLPMAAGMGGLAQAWLVSGEVKISRLILAWMRPGPGLLLKPLPGASSIASSARLTGSEAGGTPELCPAADRWSRMTSALFSHFTEGP